MTIMRRITKYLIIMGIVYAGYACSDNDSDGITLHDPTLPVSIQTFMPDSGGIRTKCIIKGSNFGSDLSKIKVYFGEKEATLLSSKGDALYALVPKQPGDSSYISVVIGEDSCTFENKKFYYHIAASVSTVTGKAKESGGKDGTLGEALFNLPRYVGIDLEDNLFVSECDNNRNRLISIPTNKVITLQSKLLLGNPGFREDRKIIYYIGDGDQTLYLFDSETQWTFEKANKIYDKTGVYFHSLVFRGDYIYTRVNNGDFIRIDALNPRPNTYKYLGKLTRQAGGQNGNLVYNPANDRIYCACSADNLIYQIQINDDETATIVEYAGGNGPGLADGPASESKFNFPRGMAVDSEGNVYVCDMNNHVIRKITLDGLVTTLTGQRGTAGYVDGSLEEALFNQPSGIAIDKDDFMYIADMNNHSIRKIAIE